MPRRHRKMRGGFLDSFTQGLSDAWNKTKSAASGAYSSVSSPSTSYTPTSTSYTPTSTSYTPTTPASYGGRRRTRRHRKMRGGYSDYSPLTGLAYSASPIKGGRTKRRSRRSRK